MKTVHPLDLKKLEYLWRQVQKPGRYTGGEWNEIKKDPDRVKVRVALAFPEVYEIGLSYLGQRILYQVLNQRPEVLAERVYAPWPDFEASLRAANLPLYSLENKIPLFQFDILGFSLLYELNHTNWLNILDLGRVPLLARQRDLNHPLVIAGGPVALNPEPLAEFIDIFAIGDGEDLVLEIIDRYLKLKESVKTREELIRGFSDLPNLYLPSFYEARPQPGSSFLIPRPRPGFPEVINKRLVYPLGKALAPKRFIVPNIQSIFDRLQVEVARGCPHNCRFCQAASLYFPYRLRTSEQTLEIARQGLITTGYEELSFNALSVGDYPFLEKTIETMLPWLEMEKVAVSLPSLRPGRLSRKVVENIVRIRKTGFTLVPEAGSERLRRVINKKILDEELLTAARYAFENGWRLLKLYFMIGLPTETAEDVRAIINLIRRLVDLGQKILGSQPAINLSVSSFIPKPHTPFQWLAMDEEKLLQQKQEYIKSNIGRWKKVELKEHPIKTSILEAVFSRGDRRLGTVLLEAYRLGARFDGWHDQFNFELWEKAFAICGLDYRKYLQAIDPSAPLPWDIINPGLKKSYFLEELRAAREARYTDSCPDKVCGRCQACDWPEYRVKSLEEVAGLGVEWRAKKGEILAEPVRYRAVYQKEGPFRFISHNDLLNQLERAIRRAGWQMAFSRGFHPKMLLSFGPALPLGMTARAEVMEFKALQYISEEEFLVTINALLPDGLKFRSLRQCGPGSRPLFQDIKRLVYTLDLSDPDVTGLDDLKVKLTEDSLNQLSEQYQGKVKIRLAPSEKKLWFFLDFEPQKPIRIQEVVERLLGLRNSVYALTREFLVFQDGQNTLGLETL